MHEVNWCENCGSILRRVQLQKTDGNGMTELVDRFECSCRGRPKPAPTD